MSHKTQPTLKPVACCNSAHASGYKHLLSDCKQCSRSVSSGCCVCSCRQANCGQLLDGVQLMYLCIWSDWQRQDPHNAGLPSRGCGRWYWWHRSSGISTILLTSCDCPFSGLLSCPARSEGLYRVAVLEVLYACKHHKQVSVAQDRGLIPRVFQELFAQIKEKQMQQVGRL